MTKREFAVFCIASFFGGIMVAMGGVGLLISMKALEGAMGKLVGAVIFSLAMFVVTTFGLYLITGLSTRLLTMPLKTWWVLLISLFFNVLGILLTVLLVECSHVDITATATALMDTKLCDEGWALHSLGSGVLCGMLIGLSVLLGKYAKEKNLSATVGVIFPIFVFVFCGFDNSLANVYYMFSCARIEWEMIAYCLISLIGNLIGGALVSVMPFLKKGNR